MKILQSIVILLLLGFAGAMQAQTLDDDLKAKEAELAAASETVAALQGEVDAIKKQIEVDAGWIKGYSGLVGFDFNKSNGWIANPNPDASSSALNIGMTGWANNIKENFFWRNKGVLTKSWQDVDLTDADGQTEDDGLFDNGTVDILNISSLAGKPLSDLIALSGLGELNTSLGNFLDPGTLDIGIGVTLTPKVDDLVIVIHPLNYHFAFSGVDGLESSGAFGAKLRADFNRDFGDVAFTSTLTSFLPYNDTKEIVTSPLTGEEFETGLFEYTWINTVSFDIWQGIGVGISLGLRNAKFESPDVQSYYSLGLSYAL